MTDLIMIDVTSPFAGRTYAHDITDITQDQLNAWAPLMDDDVREAVTREVLDLDATPAQWLAVWARHVGPDVAGAVILGS